MVFGDEGVNGFVEFVGRFVEFVSCGEEGFALCVLISHICV